MKLKRLMLSTLLIMIMQFVFAQTQAEMNQTAIKDYKVSDAKMTATYKKVLATMDSNGKQLLIAAQRAWIKYKEAHCASVANEYEGGSMKPLILYSCLKEITDARIEQLKSLQAQDQ